jgi:hypothetical protein
MVDLKNSRLWEILTCLSSNYILNFEYKLLFIIKEKSFNKYNGTIGSGIEFATLLLGKKITSGCFLRPDLLSFG